ncbi:uncharacterized protein LOC131854081 [Achroia grisella]|uniref:uncharacterized protein LOC131854081 n=1 Tax=Achroia grisella TaxID=688607 RepID=UPI0027D2E4B8|nr:uncharacterized protein LOC131854081 [Achroia grisella]
MRRVMRQCHCAMLAYPALPNVVRCTPELLDCAKYAAATLNVKKCKCLHTCNVDKEFPTYFSNRLIPGSHSHDSFYDGFDLTKVSVVRLFVLKRKINASERHAVFSETDLFSQLGGAFSLFFGCSILSLLEILQIFRHWFHARKNTGIVSTKLKNNKKPYKKNETKTKKKVKFST